jgi:hypothetical protein
MNGAPTTLQQIANEMFLSAGRFEKSARAWESELFGIFTGAERKLFERRSSILSAIRASGGNMDGSTEALARIQTLSGQIRSSITDDLIRPARDWADRSIPEAWRQGRDLARTNLAFDQIPRDVVRESFLHVRPASAGILTTGLRDTYTILNTVGNDMGEFFRTTMTEAAILGIPIQGPGDTLEARLFESGRVRPQTIKTASGKIVRRSVRQRAVAIARVESAKVYNRVHEEQTKAVFGDDAVYANANPEDRRSTEICLNASNQDPMTLAEWDASPYKRPPRLRPDFHLCRSFLIGGTRAIFDAAHGDTTGTIDKARKSAGSAGPGTPPSETPKAKFQREVREMTEKGTPTDATMIAVGNRIRQEMKTGRFAKLVDAREKGTLDRINVLRGDREALSTKWKTAGADTLAARARPDRTEFLGDDPVWREARRRFIKLDTEIRRISTELNDLSDNLAAARGEATLDLLAEVRDFGPTKGIAKTLSKGKSAVRPHFDAITKYVPTDWLAGSAARGPVKFRKVQRGFYRDRDATITISGDGRSAQSTAIHEFGHRTEATFADILDVEKQFFERRTAGEVPRWIGKGYSHQEVSKFDKFTETYMGKEYKFKKMNQLVFYGGAKAGDHYAFELLSMGLEGVFFGKYNLADGDPEFLDFILGLLASGGKR